MRFCNRPIFSAAISPSNSKCFNMAYQAAEEAILLATPELILPEELLLFTLRKSQIFRPKFWKASPVTDVPLSRSPAAHPIQPHLDRGSIVALFPSNPWRANDEAIFSMARAVIGVEH